MKNSSIIVALAITLAAISLFIYTISKNREFYAEQTIRCKNAGQEERMRELEKQTFATTWFDPQYLYSKNLNTCVYKGGYHSGGGSYYFIKDLYTGMYIAEWSHALTGETITGDQQEYQKAINELGF